ncbi:DUF4296 domain-containing protein [Riemerella columbina]|uniref:DUF4296 domain-containing protein n=1 Tax=Riemerella columbina TaxID=103810 RepID=UPI0026704121|nr:DUF4296 domain-containing protein [Riemerella columbina]WKS95494.1 DUF4296 domain-containing protein [Riemerella columbina]
MIKRWLFFGLMLGLCIACRPPAQKPSELLSKQEMAQIIADYALYSQSPNINRQTDVESINHFVLQKNKTKAKTFTESFNYYLVKPSDIDDIYDEAQALLLKKNPALEQYIKEKIEKQKNTDQESLEPLKIEK